jgi:nicotinamidase-related amidase
VVWVQHFSEQLASGSAAWRIVPELTPGDDEPLVEKTYGDSFEDATLETVLSGLGVGRLVVVGAETDACVRSTLHGAFVKEWRTRRWRVRSDAPPAKPLSAAEMSLPPPGPHVGLPT